jgi:hypothetical protein
MRFYLLLLILLFAGMECSKNRLEDIPSCIQKKINQIKSKPRWNPPATVTEYRYKEKRVFLFSADCCDQYYQVYDENCQYLCAPSGGITGRGDGLCADFAPNAILIRMVWKDDR